MGAGPCRSGEQGFTILEVMLVIALIGVFLTAIAFNIESLFRTSEAGTVEAAFWEASRAARTDALLNRRTETVRYDEASSTFLIEGPGGEVTRRVDIDRKDWREDLRLKVQFMKRLASSQFTLVSGELIELRAIPSIQFFPDGTCTPFVLQLEVGDVERSIEIDPWTGAELLPENEA